MRSAVPVAVLLFVALATVPAQAQPANPTPESRAFCRGPDPAWSYGNGCGRHHRKVMERREARRAATYVPPPEPAPAPAVTTPTYSTGGTGICGGTTPYEGGGQCWAIPYDIVQCESGGSYTAYNSSGASGAYQLMNGGTGTPAEQDAAAAALWNGGAGRDNWVC